MGIIRQLSAILQESQEILEEIFLVKKVPIEEAKTKYFNNIGQAADILEEENPADPHFSSLFWGLRYSSKLQTFPGVRKINGVLYWNWPPFKYRYTHSAYCLEYYPCNYLPEQIRDARVSSHIHSLDMLYQHSSTQMLPAIVNLGSVVKRFHDEAIKTIKGVKARAAAAAQRARKRVTNSRTVKTAADHLSLLGIDPKEVK